MHDPFGAFCAFHDVSLSGREGGPLGGLTFAVKDVFDIAGHKTGAGNPDYLRDARPAGATAPVVQLLLDAGADLVGKTHCDELCYGVEGENFHYGTPVNPSARGRVPGGSSSGSAVAVAGKLVDFALGTDTGASVRLPASFCGIYGIRPSHGRVSTAGVVPLAPSIDTVGWLTRDAELLGRVGEILLGDDQISFTPKRLLYAAEVWELAAPSIVTAVQPALRRLIRSLGEPKTISVCPDGMDAWQACRNVIQGLETWRCHGEWVTASRPKFGPRVAKRFEYAAGLDPALEAPARAQRQRYRENLQRLLGNDGLICVPTGPCIAPLPNSPDIDATRLRVLAMLSIAGLTGAPQISVPVATSEDCPVGLSLIAPPGTDRALLAFVKDHFAG